MVFKKNWYLLVGFLLGILILGVLPYNYIIEPALPKICIDPDAKVANSVGYLPVEMTGKTIEQGRMVSVCSVPKEYLPYVHNRQQGEWDLLNPSSNLNLGLRYGSIAFLILVAGFVSWRLVILRKRRIR